MSQNVDFGDARCAIPDGYRPMTPGERGRFYPSSTPAQAWIDPGRQAVARFDAGDDALPADGVERRLAEYYSLYARMAPGFQGGETLKKELPGGAVGVMSFKSNAPARDLFNILAVVSAGGREHAALFSCGMEDAAGLALEWSGAFSGIQVLAPSAGGEGW